MSTSSGDDVPVPSFGPRLVCTYCGTFGCEVRPNWADHWQPATRHIERLEEAVAFGYPSQAHVLNSGPVTFGYPRQRRYENGGRRTSQPLNSAAEIWFRGAVGTPNIDPQLAIRCQNPIKNG